MLKAVGQMRRNVRWRDIVFRRHLDRERISAEKTRKPEMAVVLRMFAGREFKTSDL